MKKTTAMYKTAIVLCKKGYDTSMRVCVANVDVLCFCFSLCQINLQEID